MKYWIITDLHLCHSMLISEKYRPENYEYQIFDNIEKKLSSGDVLINIGDVSIYQNSDAHEMYNTFLMYKNVKSWLIRGNHDRKSYQWYLEHGWDFVADSITINRYGLKILLSHIPEKNFSQFDVNIHGHFHDSDHRTYEPEISSRVSIDHYYLVSLEKTGYTPLSLDFIIKDFQKKKKMKKTKKDVILV